MTAIGQNIYADNAHAGFADGYRGTPARLAADHPHVGKFAYILAYVQGRRMRRQNAEQLTEAERMERF